MMNQISNPGQQPGHHSAQPVAPHQQQNICFAPAQQYHGDGYDPRQQEQSYQQNVAY
uniref:Antennapedia n=1 Tax=Panagrolaimus sp. ES5 TaxID=591445 RepID=A0AC34GM81_9BILA